MYRNRSSPIIESKALLAPGRSIVDSKNDFTDKTAAVGK